MNMTLLDFADRLVPVSDFSQGKAGKIFSDVAENNTEYIVLKNNQPTAVVVSVKEYREIQKKINQLEKMLEAIEDARLLSLANERENSETMSFEDVLKEEGISLDEIKELAESVEIE